MIKVVRTYSTKYTTSTITTDTLFKCFGLELPNARNLPFVSCILEGLYYYEVGIDSKGNTVLHIKDVHEREYIQVHSGNFIRNIEGCVLVGDSIKYLDSDDIPDVTNSVLTLGKLIDSIPSQGTILFTNTYTQNSMV